MNPEDLMSRGTVSHEDFKYFFGWPKFLITDVAYGQTLLEVDPTPNSELKHMSGKICITLLDNSMKPFLAG